jgi:hypothetical protein
MKQKNLFLFLISGLIVLPLIASAAGLVPCGPGTAKPTCQLCDLFVMFQKIVNFIIFDIVPPLAALMVAIGGFMWIFAMGEAAKIDQSKKLFMGVGWGLIIIYGAWVIINTFFWVIGATVWEGGKWWVIPC